MSKRSKALAFVAVAAVVGMTAACSSSKGTPTVSAPQGATGYNAAVKGDVNPSTKQGGTLKVTSSQDVDSLDGAVQYYAFTWNLSQFYNRTLLSYDEAPGADSTKLVPDLATALPTISSDGLTYTFKIRSGLKFDTGEPITSETIKYGIERIFAQDVIPGGPVYLISQLDQGQNYPGPYKDTDPNKLGLKTVTTPDDNTIVFHLKTPFADFPYLLSMPGAAPVPKDKDTGAKYTNNPSSSGPYSVKSYTPGQSIIWVRNPNWTRASDPVHKALPNEIDLTINSNSTDLDQRLIAGTEDLDVGQVGVGTQAQDQILQDPKLKANADDPVDGFIRYIAMSTKVAPFDNINCREAVIYAADHTAMQTARGGKYAGAIATNMLPSNINGSDNFDPFNIGQGAPQIDKAKAALAACGKPNGFNTTIAVRNNKPKEVAVAVDLQAALKKVGINVTVYQYDGKLISSVVGSPSNVHAKGYGLIEAGWGADWQSGYGFLEPLIDGTEILPTGNNNFTEVNDPQIQTLLGQAATTTDPTKAAAIYKQLNHYVTSQALYLGVVFDQALNYRNPRLTNVFITNAFGMVDFAPLGVDDGK